MWEHVSFPSPSLPYIRKLNLPSSGLLSPGPLCIIYLTTKEKRKENPKPPVKTLPDMEHRFQQQQGTSKEQKPETARYSSETGIYNSKYPAIPLPSDPFLDVVSFIFSRNHDGRTAFVDSFSGSSISYSQLFPLVRSVASGLAAMGIRQADVVLLLLPSSIYFPVLFLGALYLGAIVTPMTHLSSLPEIMKRTADCNPSIVFAGFERVADLQQLSEIPFVAVPEKVMTLAEDKAKFEAFHKLLSCRSSDLAPRPLIRQQDPAAILYSSGTTGASKGVVLTHRNFISSVELVWRFEASLYEYLSWKNVYLAALPMFHIYGLSLFVMGLVSLGSTVVVMRRFDANELLKVIDEWGVTHFPVVPPILAALTKMANGLSGNNSLKTLKQVSCGGAPLSSKTIQDFLETFPRVDLIQGYGMTESTALGTRGFNTKTFRKYTSVGLLTPNTQARVVDCVSGSFLPPGRSGELLLRAPGIMEGYLNNKQATEATIDKDGWLRTGDIAVFDQDGFLHIHDRLKEMIKYKGFQIAPADLEAVLITHPEILDAAVTGDGTMDLECGEVPVAFVVKRQGSKLTEAAIIYHVAKQVVDSEPNYGGSLSCTVAPYKKIRKVVFTNSIPRSAAGKILRRELKDSLTSRL